MKPQPDNNQDDDVVEGFGDEWSRFSQESLGQEEKQKIFTDYFKLFPWDTLPAGSSTGADIGCGSGRWASLVAPRVGHLHLIDASRRALEVARNNLAGETNVSFYHSSVSDIPLEDDSLDFAYSLGVLHHVPDTNAAIASVARKLKPGAPLLLYLYYAFDNRPLWYRGIWWCSDLMRRLVSGLPHTFRYAVSQLLALTVYWPLARLARLLEKLGFLPESWPLMYYRNKSLYTMRTDALDRFGTRLEQRFTKKQIRSMLEENGFEGIRFSDSQPFWCAIGFKKKPVMTGN